MMKLSFFDGPLEGQSAEIASNSHISKILIEDNRGKLVRYECDLIDDIIDSKTGHSVICRMVLSRLPVEFDYELRISLAEDR